MPGESLANAANSTDGSSVREDGLPRPSRTVDGQAKPDGLGSPSSIAAPPELANHPDYELIKELGQGGMGTVYLAKNRMMDRHEVLKVISKALLDRPGALERFQQEIRSAAKLAHPNIVAAYSVLRPGDLLVFAMEYVRGQDLAAVGIAIVAEHFGRQRVLCTHPFRQQPCVLTASVDLPPNKSSLLLLDVSHHRSGDRQLIVKANGEQLYDGAVGPSTTTNGWLTLSLDLTRFAGKQVALELHNKATGWQFEWGRRRIAQSDSRPRRAASPTG
ncbi:MAG TPA: protein kinase [Pirellulales bacterium]|nr:protein kinase [Pirellulales bacterium]